MTLLLEESGKKFGEQRLYVFFRQYERRDRRSFKNMELSIQRLNFLFLCSLLSWSNLFVENITLSLVDFINWLGLD